jgi:hypothetical protein
MKQRFLAGIQQRQKGTYLIGGSMKKKPLMRSISQRCYEVLNEFDARKPLVVIISQRGY